MRLGIKMYYMSVGFQVMGALVFALLGRLSPMLFALFFAVVSWYLGEYRLDQEKDNQ